MTGGNNCNCNIFCKISAEVLVVPKSISFKLILNYLEQVEEKIKHYALKKEVYFNCVSKILCFTYRIVSIQKHKKYVFMFMHLYKCRPRKWNVVHSHLPNKVKQRDIKKFSFSQSGYETHSRGQEFFILNMSNRIIHIFC